VHEIWVDKSKLNASIIAAFAIGEKKKTYVFQFDNPRYNAANGDFIVDAVSFGGKNLPTFTSTQDVKISDVALWIDDLGVVNGMVIGTSWHNR